MDYALGEVISYLEETGKDANTIMVYGTDHGGYAGTFGIPEKAPGICSEAVCRVPMLWYVPGVTGRDWCRADFVENIDITPTLISLCNLPQLETTDGHDLTPLLKGEDKPVREVAMTENVWSKALRWGPWRFVHYPKRFSAPMWANCTIWRRTRTKPRICIMKPRVAGHFLGVPQATDGAADDDHAICHIIARARRLACVPHRHRRRDGKESNKVGVEERIRRNRINYI